MNIPYKVPLLVSTDDVAVNLGVQEPKSVELDMTVGVYAEIGNLQTKEKAYTPTTSPQTDTITADDGFDGLEAVNVSVNAVQEGELVQSEMFEVPQFIQVDNTGLITAVGNGQDTVFPVSSSGWLNAGENGVTLYLYGEATKQLPTQPAATVTPNDTQQTIVPAGKFTTGDIKVDPIPRTVNDFLGRDAEYIRDIHSHDYVLSSTGYNSWTPSTTAASIVATQSLTAFAGDLANYEYCVRWLFDADIKYNSGTTQKAIILREVEEVWQVIAKRPSSLANIGANNFNGNNCSTYFTAALMDYYNTSGTRTFTWSASYGLYLSMTAATFSNSTSDTPNITIKTPAIYARCSNTYFSTARAADVDKANSKMAIKGELYRVKKDSSPSRIMFGHVVDLYNDSIIS